jgi:hypothetical protein
LHSVVSATLSSGAAGPVAGLTAQESSPGQSCGMLPRPPPPSSALLSAI